MATSAGRTNGKHCVICGQACLGHSMLQNSPRGYICEQCFRKEDCNAPVVSPHRQRSRVQTMTAPSCNVKEKCDKLFPHPAKFCVKARTESTISIPFATVPLISKKPLQCPHLNCGKFVGVLDLVAHFKFEHKDVAHINTHFDARSALEFSPKIIQHGLVRTMVLLTLNGFVPNIQPSLAKISSNMSVIAPKSVQAAVLATKIIETDLEEKPDKKEHRRKRDRSADLKDTDKWIFWVGTNISTNFSYTIATSSRDNQTRFKYFGPVSHLDDTPIKICNSGRCLVVNKYQLEGISQNFQNNLNLDVVVYSEE